MTLPTPSFCDITSVKWRIYCHIYVTIGIDTFACGINNFSVAIWMIKIPNGNASYLWINIWEMLSIETTSLMNYLFFVYIYKNICCFCRVSIFFLNKKMIIKTSITVKVWKSTMLNFIRDTDLAVLVTE